MKEEILIKKGGYKMIRCNEWPDDHNTIGVLK
jgi:hypothetical protein